MERGAWVDQAEQVGATPLLSASENGHLGIVEYLLAQGADLRKETEDGSTALFMARRCPCCVATACGNARVHGDL